MSAPLAEQSQIEAVIYGCAAANVIPKPTACIVKHGVSIHPYYLSDSGLG